MKKWQDRQGVWVETDQGIGIRTSEKMDISGNEFQVGYVDIVDSAGATIAARVPEASLTNVRLARRASIPPDRIAHLSAEQLARMGYV